MTIEELKAELERERSIYGWPEGAQEGVKALIALAPEILALVDAATRWGDHHSVKDALDAFNAKLDSL